MRREPSVHLDEYLHVVTRYGMHRVYERDGLVELRPRQFQVAIAERIELQPQIAPVHHLLRGLREGFRGALYGVPAVRIGGNAVMHLAADEFVDGQIGLLADDVPAGHLDEGKRRHHHFAR